MADVIIIGTGPAGISAALYTVRAKLDTIIIGRDGGALSKAEKIENYYGFENAVSGEQLLSQGISQAKRLGAEIITDEVIGMGFDGAYIVKTKSKNYKAKIVIMATGSPRKKPAIKNLADFEGKGVSYCATCDAFFYRDKNVAVLGSGDYALSEALELAPTAKQVTILTDGENFMQDMPESHRNINIIQTKISEINGENVLEEILFDDGSKFYVNGLFIAVGVAGSADLAKKIGAQTDGTKIIVDEKMATNISGLFAAGDCTGGMLQIAKAVYEGAKAGTEVVKYHRSLPNLK